MSDDSDVENTSDNEAPEAPSSLATSNTEEKRLEQELNSRGIPSAEFIVRGQALSDRVGGGGGRRRARDPRVNDCVCVPVMCAIRVKCACLCPIPP